MAATFKLELVTPERLLFADDAESVIVPGGAGEFQVLPDHLPLVSTLRPGGLTVVSGGKTLTFHVSEGFIEVDSDKVIVLAEHAEGDFEIDVDAARAAASEAEDRLSELGHENLEERNVFQSALDVARTRIEVWEKREGS